MTVTAAPLAASPPADMQRHILDVASRLFYENGLRAVGIDWVIREAGIAKATLYRHFPTKEQLVLAYLAGRRERALEQIRATALAAGPDAQARVDAIFNRLHRVAKKGFRGCAFLRALSEHLDSPEIQEAVSGHKNAVREIFREAVAPLGASGRRSTEIAAVLALIYDGALVTVMVQKQPGAVLLGRQAARAVLAAQPG